MGLGLNEPIDSCGQCGEDLYLDIPHECPVGGNVVEVTERGGEMNRPALDSLNRADRKVRGRKW